MPEPVRVPLDPVEIFRALERHGVRYVVIGGLAGVLMGAPVVTNDADICPDRSPMNLERLAAALRELNAGIRIDTEPDGVPFACDREFLEGVAILNLRTRHGDLDISFQPAGTTGYGDLAADAATVRLAGRDVAVASLRDVIRSKEAANRPKDQVVLPILRALLDDLGDT